MKKSKAYNPKIDFISGDQFQLDDVKGLWERLNQHHKERSPCFKSYYAKMTFPKRKAMFLQKAARGEMRVDIAFNEETSEHVGYCISSIDADGTGEVESIYVLESYRRLGIGSLLIKAALAWMELKGVTKKTVIVAAGNETVFKFYERFGFHIRKTMLEQV